MTGTYWQPVVSLPHSSNRTCPFRASGFPTHFTNKLTKVSQYERHAAPLLPTPGTQPGPSIKPARRDRLSFLGYSFGPHRLRKNGQEYLGASPSKKSVSRLRQKVGDLLVHPNMAPCVISSIEFCGDVRTTSVTGRASWLIERSTITSMNVCVVDHLGSKTSLRPVIRHSSEND